MTGQSDKGRAPPGARPGAAGGLRISDYQTLLNALRLHVEWGADAAIEVRPAAPAVRAAVAPAISGAAVCDNLEALRGALAGLDCALARTATTMALADGNHAAGLVFVGEAPGEAEDVTGRPLVGPVGQFFDRMLGSIGVDRSRCYIVNLVPWRPPGGRAPTPEEVALCLPYLRRHLALVAPTIVVSLGALPSQALLGSQETIGRLRGRWRDIELEGRRARLLPMLHPGGLLRAPERKREAWQDLLTLATSLQAAAPADAKV